MAAFFWKGLMMVLLAILIYFFKAHWILFTSLDELSTEVLVAGIDRIVSGSKTVISPWTLNGGIPTCNSWGYSKRIYFAWLANENSIFSNYKEQFILITGKKIMWRNTKTFCHFPKSATFILAYIFPVFFACLHVCVFIKMR